MKRVAVAVLVLTLLGVSGCGEEASEPAPSGNLEAPEALAPGAHVGPEEVVRLWLDAAKRGDAEAMSALWAEDQRLWVKTSSDAFAAEVASGTLHAARWNVGTVAGKGEARTVTAHVVWREIPDGGDNLEFRFVQRDGRWWIVCIADYD